MGSIVDTARMELGVSLKTRPGRVREYFSASRSNYTGWDPIKESWCTHFAFWVLQRAGFGGLVPKTSGGSYSVSRFLYNLRELDEPTSDCLYYMPVVNGKSTYHIGIIADFDGSTLTTIDGNSGSWKDPRTNWGSGHIGGGMVAENVGAVSSGGGWSTDRGKIAWIGSAADWEW